MPVPDIPPGIRVPVPDIPPDILTGLSRGEDGTFHSTNTLRIDAGALRGKAPQVGARLLVKR